MKNFRRNAREVNAGSMADIAFLLLIFFLVTTTISADKGILRKLPEDCKTPDCNVKLNERNIFRIYVNKDNEIMVENEIVQLSELKDLAINFVDNNGDNTCDYCNGRSLKSLSDKPEKAVISLKHDALTNYGTYISVQDEISEAYFKLREDYAKKTYDKRPSELTQEELKATKKAYPFILSEVNVKRD